MADDFLTALMVGLAILGVLLVVFLIGLGGSIFGYGATGYAAGPNFFSYYSGNPIFVGANSINTVDTLYTRFDANNFIQTNVYNLDTRRTYNGLLFGSQPVRVDVGYSEFTTLSFDVVNTNGYGDLIIKLDGFVLEKRRFDPGHYEMSFEPRGGQTIEILAESSEWRIWAPTIYDLENVFVYTNAYPRGGSAYTFNVVNVSEVQSVRMDVFMEENAGALLMTLNGDVVYDGAVNQNQSIYIDPRKLEDVNIMRFDARDDSRFSGRAVIALTRNIWQQKDLIVDINLTQGEYDSFDHGVISFDVVDVVRPGGYSVTIYNNGVLMQEYVKLEQGYFALNVDRTDLRPGVNTFVIRPADNSAFTIQNFMTRL